MTVARVLRSAADLLEPEGQWTQGVLAEDRKGNPCGPTDSLACRWCMDGAIRRYAPNERIWGAALNVVRQVTGRDVELFNEDSERTQAEVVAALRAAADEAEL